MRPVGFSTGALAKGDFRRALERLRATDATAVELSALRGAELAPLLAALDDLDLARFEHVSVHAPGRFPAREEGDLVARFVPVAERGWPIVVHPDAIHEPARWAPLGPLLLLENMDRRKPGRTADELAPFFARLPEAGLCLDLAHARQVDPTMAEAERLVERSGDRLREIHLSELDDRGEHHRLSPASADAFRRLARRLPAGVPVILESPFRQGDPAAELAAARSLLAG
ncbi:MAG TPA: hypothetical protein VHQ65_07090 [Thermoanaerobaculia bacterium]|nr:hypothetical protein [Thermoanaerobaculia bacterium]